jgi:hypothetical protein
MAVLGLSLNRNRVGAKCNEASEEFPDGDNQGRSDVFGSGALESI